MKITKKRKELKKMKNIAKDENNKQKKLKY